MRVAIYTRISQDRTGDSVSTSVQYKACKEVAEQKGLEVVDLGEPFSDNDATAYNLKRPRKHFLRLVQAIHEREIDGVVVMDWSRLLRTIEDFVALTRSPRPQITVHTVHAGTHDLNQPGDAFIATIMAAVAKHESHQKSHRHVDANYAHAELGKDAGGRRPMGYDRIVKASGEVYDPQNPDHQKAPKKLVLNEPEATAIRRAAEDIIAGNSLTSATRKAEAYLRENGRTTPLPGVTFKKVLLSDRVRGERVYQTQENRDLVASLKQEGKEWWLSEEKHVFPAEWPAILTREVSDQVRQILKHDQRRTGGRRPRSLLSGILFCGRPGCVGAVMGHSTRGERKGRSYSCSGLQGGCGRVGIGGGSIEEMLVGLTLARLTATPADSIFPEHEEAVPTMVDDDHEAKRSRLNERQAATIRAYNEELISDEQYFDTLRAIKSEREALGVARERLEARQLKQRGIVTTEAAWDEATTVEKNLTMRAIFGRVYIKPSTKRGPTVDLDRVVWRYRTRQDWETELAGGPLI